MPYKVSRCDQGASKDGSPIAARSLFESELKKQSMGQSMEGGGGGEEGGERRKWKRGREVLLVRYNHS